MKFLLIALAIAQVSCAPSTLTDINALQNQRGLLDIWDIFSPLGQPIALIMDTTLQAISNTHQAVTEAVSNAIHTATSWIGGLIPPLGKRDLSINTRVNLLNQLQSFQTGFQQSIREFIQAFLNGSLFTSNNIFSEIKQHLTKLYNFMQTHVTNISQAINALLSDAKDPDTSKVLISSANAVQIIQQALQIIHALFSS